MSYMIQDSLSVCIEYIMLAEMEYISWIPAIG